MRDIIRHYCLSSLTKDEGDQVDIHEERAERPSINEQSTSNGRRDGVLTALCLYAVSACRPTAPRGLAFAWHLRGWVCVSCLVYSNPIHCGNEFRCAFEIIFPRVCVCVWHCLCHLVMSNGPCHLLGTIGYKISNTVCE